MASKAQYIPGTVAQELQLALGRELHEGETIVWQGMKLARVDAKAFRIYLFAIPWTAFALFWISLASLGVASADAGIMGWAFPLFGVPFVLIGLGMMMTPFLSYFQRGRVLFAVTDRRVLKLSLGGELTVNSIPAGKILDTIRRESSDGSGTIDLSLASDIEQYGGRRSRKMEFGRVDDVFGAYQAIATLTGKAA